MDNDRKEAVNDAQSEVTAHEFTPMGMVSFLLKNGFTVDQIEGRIVAPSDFVKECLSSINTIGDNPGQPMLMLKNLYLREQIKSFLRAIPYLGAKKGAQRIGITQKEYRAVYDELVGSGEVTFVTDMPDWGGDGEKKPLRKHIVK